MGRHLYSLILILCLPLLIGHVVRKYRREKSDPMVRHRLGLELPMIRSDTLWIHACSLGECKVGLALARMLITQDPSLKILITATTPSGLNLLSDSEFESHVFPWDFPWVWSQWLRRLTPKALIVMETELWPNLVAACHESEVPVILANGRLSDRSVRGYLRFGWLTQPMWSKISRALMQFSGDAHHAHLLGVHAHAISEVGSIKLDQPVPLVPEEQSHQVMAWKNKRPLVCLMSSHPEDDALFMRWAHQEPHIALLIVPRHPVRGADIRHTAVAAGLTACQMSQKLDPGTQLLIGDTFGHMGAYISQSDVIVIGGSFSGKGGQNPIEPARLKKPLVAGPSMYNFQAITEGLETAGGMVRADAENLSEVLVKAMENAELMGSAAEAWVEAHRGSTALQTQAILAAIAPD
jgi:3-deoxy-D-manno-octulosonic-acid transferase